MIGILKVVKEEEEVATLYKFCVPPSQQSGIMDSPTLPMSSISLRHKFRRASEGLDIESANRWFMRRRKVCVA